MMVLRRVFGAASAAALTIAAATAAMAVTMTAATQPSEAAEGDPRVQESATAALGRRLFHDPAVSRSGTVACASCHDPERGWSDRRTVSQDERAPTRRHSQPVTDLRGDGFHWDGEFRTPEELIVARIGDPGDAAEGAARRARARRERSSGEDVPAPGYGATTGSPRGTPSIPDRLSEDDRYRAAFRSAFGSEQITSARIVRAVNDFVTSLRTQRNPLDDYLAGDRGSLTADAVRGLALFRGKAGCVSCHSLGRAVDGRVLLSDGRFHNTGVAFAGGPPSAPPGRIRLPISGQALTLGTAAARQAIDGGRAEHTFTRSATAAFKTPSLRDVARRGPFMHDGSLASLEDVVRYYSKGGTPNDHLDPAIRRLDLTDHEVDDLVALLRSMSGTQRAGLLPARRTPKRVKLTIVNAGGAPVPDLEFEVVPAGERLGDGPRDAPVLVRTGADGVAEFVFPQTTHVRLEAPLRKLALGRLIPDLTDDLRVVASPSQ